MYTVMEEIPSNIRRRVAQLLENVRGTEMDPTGGEASLTGQVVPLFRPDLSDVAYYEFEVDLGRQSSSRVSSASDLGAGRPVPPNLTAKLPAQRGFVVASTGDHDHPICHWSLDREPPSRQLADAAEANGDAIERIYKLDALSYVGESKAGGLVAQSGQLPRPITGLPDEPAKGRGKISSTLSQPTRPSPDDETAADVTHETIRRGRARRVDIGTAESWSELRDIYGDTFAPLLADLADRAAPAWKIDRLIDEFGEGVMTGSARRIALLESEAVVELSGQGVDLVDLATEQRRGEGTVELRVADVDLDREVPFELHLAYGSGLREDLRFFAVSPTTRSGRKAGSGMSAFGEVER